MEHKPPARNIKPGLGAKSGRPPKNARPQKKKRKKITPDYLRNSGLHYLQRFACSTAQFRRVMLRKVTLSLRDHPEQSAEDCTALVEALIADFTRAQLLDDAQYLRGAVSSLRRQGKSRKSIIGKLGTKGMGTQQIQDMLQHLETEENAPDEFAAALLFARKKGLGPFAKPPARPDETPDPQAMMLRRKKELLRFSTAGFSYETACRVLDAAPEDCA